MNLYLDFPKGKVLLEQYKFEIDDYFYKRIEFYTSIIPYYGVVYALETNNQELLEKEIKNLKALQNNDIRRVYLYSTSMVKTKIIKYTILVIGGKTLWIK